MSKNNIARFNKNNKNLMTESIRKTYVLNKPIAKSIVDDIVRQMHEQGFIIVPRKEIENYKKQIDELLEEREGEE